MDKDAFVTFSTLWFSLFFLASGIGVLAFELTWLQAIASFSPLTPLNNTYAPTKLYIAHP